MFGKDAQAPAPLVEFKGKFGDVINDPVLNEAYPPIQDLRANVKSGPAVQYEDRTRYTPMFGEFDLAARDYRELPGKAGHEAYGHAVAEQNQWAPGSSAKLAGSEEAYMKDPGELFARINERRLGYTQDQIDAKNFWEDTIEPNPKGPGYYPSTIDYSPEMVNKSGSLVRGDIDRSVDPPRIMTPYEYEMKLEAEQQARAELIRQRLIEQHGTLPAFYTPEMAMAEKIKRNKEINAFRNMPRR